MTVRAPTEENPQPVVAWPGWFWWRGADGVLHAGRAAGEVQAHNFTTLLGRIRRAEGGNRGGSDR